MKERKPVCDHHLFSRNLILMSKNRSVQVSHTLKVQEWLWKSFTRLFYPGDGATWKNCLHNLGQSRETSWRKRPGRDSAITFLFVWFVIVLQADFGNCSNNFKTYILPWISKENDCWNAISIIVLICFIEYMKSIIFL